MKTKATSAPVAAFAAPVKSVSLREDVTFVPSALARALIPSTGYHSEANSASEEVTLAYITHRDKVWEVVRSILV